MQEKTKKGTSVVIVIVILVVLAVAGYFYANRERVSDELLTSTPTGKTSLDSEFIVALRDLKKVKLDKSIFENPVWLELQDFGQSIAPEKPGRLNPFAPITISGSAFGTTPRP